MKNDPTLKVTKDFTEHFKEIINQFRNDKVLVGIPEVKSPRKKEDEEESKGINNAYLLAINNFGSPDQNIPARPVMEIGIRNAQKDIAEQYKKAAIQALTKGPEALEFYYNRAGLIAANSIKIAINSQEGFEGPAKSTLATRKAQGFKGTKALIVTGQMRNSITYVIKGRS